MKNISQEDNRLRLADQLYEILSNWYGEVSKLGDDVAAFSERSEAVDFGVGAPTSSVKDVALSIYGSRRVRDEVFDCPELFGEPAWEMLLDLAVAEGDGNRLSVSALCIGSCSAPTTALRYIKAMEQAGIVRREEDAADARRTYVRLSAKGKKMFHKFGERIAEVSDRVSGDAKRVPKKLNVRTLVS